MRTYNDSEWKQKVHAGTRAGRIEARAAKKKKRKARAHIGVCMSYRRESVERIAACVAANAARTAAQDTVRAAEAAEVARITGEPNNFALKVVRSVVYAARREAAAWHTLADDQIAADKVVDEIAAVKFAANEATRRTLVVLESLNKRAHELHVRRLEKLKKFYITL